MPSEISYPFAVGPDGRIAATQDPDRQINQHVHALLSTEPGERVMLTDYGVQTRSLLFMPEDDVMSDQIADDVREKMATYEPGILVRSVDPVAGEYGDGLAEVRLDYVRRESAATDFAISRGTNTAVISIGGTVEEVVRG